MLLFLRMHDLSVRAWFGIDKNHAVDVLLGLSSIKICINMIFTTDRKIVLWNWKPGAITLSNRATSSISPDKTVLQVNTQSQEDASSDESDLGRIACQVTIPAHAQAAILVNCRGDGLVKIETNGHFAECRCSVKDEVQWAFYRGKLFYVYIVNVTAKPVHVLKFMIVAYAPSVPTCIMHANEDEPHMLTD